RALACSLAPKLATLTWMAEPTLKDVLKALARLEKGQDDIRSEVVTARSEMATKEEMADVRADVTAVRADVTAVRAEVNAVRTDVNTHRAETKKQLCRSGQRAHQTRGSAP